MSVVTRCGFMLFATLTSEDQLLPTRVWDPCPNSVLRGLESYTAAVGNHMTKLLNGRRRWHLRKIDFI